MCYSVQSCTMWKSSILKILFSVAFFGLCNGDLKHLQVIFCEGNHTPQPSSVLFPNDPHINDTYKPYGYHMLTNDGKRLMYSLGLDIRKKYKDFLVYYDEDYSSFRSFDTFRIISDSAQLVSAGVYPATDYQLWLPTMVWQPIPLDTQQVDIIYEFYQCSNYKRMLMKALNEDSFLKKKIKELEPFLNFLSSKTGGDITLDKTFALYALLKAQHDWELNWADWIFDVYPVELNKAAVVNLKAYTITQEMRQLSGGLWVVEILNNIEQFIKGETTKNRIFFSTLELHLSCLMLTLNMSVEEVPSYGSTLFFELHDDPDKNYTVKIYYKKDQVPYLVPIRGCKKNVCTLDEFRKIASSFILDDPMEACGEIVPNEY